MLPDKEMTFLGEGLWTAASIGWTDELGRLLTEGANIEEKNPSGSRALHCASRLGDVKAVKFLLGQGAEVNVQTKHGETALHYAATGAHISTARRGSHSAIVRMLLDNRALVHLKTTDGATPLLGAALQGRGAAVQMLLEKNADPNLKTNDLLTPLFVACAAYHPKP